MKFSQPQSILDDVTNSQETTARKGLSLKILGAAIILLWVTAAVTIGTIFMRGSSPRVTTTEPLILNKTISPQKAIIDLTQLGGKPITTVEKILGKPVKIDVIRDYPDDMPGEYRDYRIKGLKGVGETETGLSVQYYKGKAVSFIVELENGAETATDALLLVGIDVKDSKPIRSALFCYV